MSNQRPKTGEVLGQLKDFQRTTVDYVFRRMYLDQDLTRRFLIADEVGLGKTLVARGIIARTIDHLWDHERRIDIVYVCSNTDIARQNIERLNVSGQDDFALSSRITLLPITLPKMDLDARLNFVSFTPGTSFDLKASAGRSDERELLYWLLKRCWDISFKSGTRVLHAYAEISNFRRRVKKFPDWNDIHDGMAEQFAADLLDRGPDLRERFDELCAEMPRAGAKVPAELDHRRNRFIGDLRRLLAKTCLNWLEPDLIILDEFQRFKRLLAGDDENASDAAQLAHHLFSYHQKLDDPLTAARVLLLSATPYKMYTLTRESENEDHYQDFRDTLDFLFTSESERVRLHSLVQLYREGLLRLADHGVETLMGVKSDLENCLRRVMVRTERLAASANRNGMLKTVASNGVQLSVRDVGQYLALQNVARSLEHDDILEYWKSSPYLLNFMEGYDLKRRLKQQHDSVDQSIEVIRALRRAESTMLSREDIERYRELDPANARLRSLHADMIEGDAWRLLWIPSSLAYYQGAGPFADPRWSKLTKRLVFSCWRVVPKAIATVLSYEAERRMMRCFRKSSRNTADARKKRLLRFAFSKGRPAGMPVLGLVYPCRTPAELLDPLKYAIGHTADDPLPTLETVLQETEARVAELLRPLTAEYAGDAGPEDEAWYWAASLLLDLAHDAESVRAWMNRADVAAVWAGDARSDDHGTAKGWERHVQHARDVLDGREKLGRPPADLHRVVALQSIAGLGNIALRCLTRITADLPGEKIRDMRSHAGPLAHAFLHLFNLPEVVSLLRDKKRETPYWRSVLEYCAAGNLQAVMDEYAHVLVESLGLVGKEPDDVAAKVSSAMRRCVTLRTSTAQADLISANHRRFQFDESLRMRTRFAMRFGDQDAEDSSEPTRADHVRAAFNSPFWPFVLATTSVGQEGLDFHPYCHAVVHWNLPSNPVDLEQREGRVHRYKGHALRKNIASAFSHAVHNGTADPWESLFSAALESRDESLNDLFPFWISPDGEAKIERHIPALPHSREITQQINLRRSLVLYRMVFGQNRQEDLVEYLLARLPTQQVEKIVDLCRIDLSPGNEGFGPNC